MGRLKRDATHETRPHLDLQEIAWRRPRDGALELSPLGAVAEPHNLALCRPVAAVASADVRRRPRPDQSCGSMPSVGIEAGVSCVYL